ncbi:4669_t:CDS:1, partial [Cetraspora pellucida]
LDGISLQLEKNPLSESEASSISPIIEVFLKHEVDRYQRNKKSRYNPMDAEHPCSTIEVPVLRSKELEFREETEFQIFDSSSNGLLCNSNIQVIKTPRVITSQAQRSNPKGLYSEEEVNARIKDATDNLHQEFIKSTEETLKNIKQKKEIECNQIKIDMRNKFEFILKKFI